MGEGDLDIGEHAVAGGRHAEVFEGHLGGRDVAVKSYRRYIHSDFGQVRMVSRRYRCDSHSLNLHYI